MIKSVLKRIFIIIIALIIGFGGAWFYARYIGNDLKMEYESAAVNQLFSAKSDYSTIVYPFRNWQMKEDPNVLAEGVLMADIDNDYIFYQKNANVRRPIASITKLMTAVIASENLPADEPVVISQKALQTDGDPAIFYLNEKVKSFDLLKALLMISSNKGAMALAEAVGEKKFISLMNEKAKELEMTQTTFVEPTGLNFLNQSSPNDLKKLLKYLLYDKPNLLLISKTPKDKISGDNPLVTHELININQITQNPQFLSDLQITYLGGKTGFTDESWQTFAGLFSVPSKRPNESPRRIVIVVLKTPNRYNDIESLLRWLDKAYIF
jgi:D-alanyl-D-alanine carboxypeptidase